MFNRNRGSSSVRNKMHEVMETRIESRKTISHDPESESKYVFIKDSEPGREIVITTMLFDLPKNS